MEQEEQQEIGPQPLSQLITCFKRAAAIDGLDELEGDFLYTSYATIMSQVCPWKKYLTVIKLALKALN